jgi:hypothetical protein
VVTLSDYFFFTIRLYLIWIDIVYIGIKERAQNKIDYPILIFFFLKRKKKNIGEVIRKSHIQYVKVSHKIIILYFMIIFIHSVTHSIFILI